MNLYSLLLLTYFFTQGIIYSILLLTKAVKPKQIQLLVKSFIFFVAFILHLGCLFLLVGMTINPSRFYLPFSAFIFYCPLSFLLKVYSIHLSNFLKNNFFYLLPGFCIIYTLVIWFMTN
jgi:hypothetical protein